jgi:hypothetical protein
VRLSSKFVLGFLLKSPSSMSHRWQSFWYILSLPLLLSKRRHHARESVKDEDRPQLSVALTAPRLTLHRGSRFVPDRPSGFMSEDIGGTLKGGVKVRQRQLVNEMLGPPVTQFALNLGREDATPLQCGFQCGPLSRI